MLCADHRGNTKSCVPQDLTLGSPTRPQLALAARSAQVTPDIHNTIARRFA